jgi:C-terminal processing protease CtpA/Prc
MFFVRWISTTAVVLFSASVLQAQVRTYSPDEIDRFASLGKLWGMLHYFHPNVLNGTVTTDSLIVPAARALAANPSAENYKQVVAAMLARTGDKATRLAPATSRPVLLLTQPQKAAVHLLPGNMRYMALPTDLDGEEELKKTGLMDDSWQQADGIVLDLRKAQYAGAAWSDQQFMADFLPALRRALIGSKRLPSLQERTAAHNGFVSQTLTQPNVYSSGWRTSVVSQAIKGSGKAYGKPFVFVLHQNSHPQLIGECMLMASAGICKVVIDAEPPFNVKGATYAITLSDSLSCYLCLSDVYTGDGKPLPDPDASMPVSDTTLSGAWVQQCLALLQAKAKPNGTNTPNLSMEYTYPRPGRYAENFYPDAGLRLMGLYNWWNAIHYFFPYKHLANISWDSVLYKHIPIMLQARDSVEYLYAVRSMVSHINDSHGFISNVNPVTPARSILGYWPPVDMNFIEGKLLLTAIGTDTAQDMSQVQLWDEVVALDGVPSLQAAEKWRNYISSSNESTYYRDVVKYMPNGPKDSKITLTLMRNGVQKQVTLIRSGRQMLRSTVLDFNDNYHTLQRMQDSVLYINMGSLTAAQADSLARTLHSEKVLLIDIRNYPQGTAWTLAPHLTTIAKKAVLFDKPLVTPDHITGGETKENLASYFTVFPADSKKAFRGRVFILCNEQTQSQAEYTIMMFQGSTACTVVGSQTAGADGNITQVAIPGGYEANFSGLGVLYPDGGQTQRTGIRVDVQVKPTIEGLKAGEDEVLQKALSVIAGK